MPPVIKWVLIAATIVAGALVLDRFLLWCEARGWIYWRKKKASPGTAASAMLELHSIVEPANKHVIEQLREEHTETDDTGAPPDFPE